LQVVWIRGVALDVVDLLAWLATLAAHGAVPRPNLVPDVPAQPPRGLAVTTGEKEGDAGPHRLADVRPLVAAVADDAAPVADGVAGLHAQLGAEQSLDIVGKSFQAVRAAVGLEVPLVLGAAAPGGHVPLTGLPLPFAGIPLGALVVGHA